MRGRVDLCILRRQTLDFAAGQASPASYTLKRLAPAKMIDAALEVTAPAIEEVHATVEKTIEPDLPEVEDVMTNVAELDGAILSGPHVTVPPTLVHPAETLTSVVPAGIVSDMVTPVAVDTPGFVTVIV